MEIVKLFIVIVGIVLILLYEWPKLKKSDKKLKRLFVAILAVGFCLSTVMIFFPDLTGPTELLLKFFRIFY